MKNRILSLSAAFIFCLGLTSCLEVFETAHFNKNGSGTMEIKSDYSKLVEMMGAFSQTAESDEPEEASITEKLKETFDAQAEQLKNVEGISGVSIQYDDEKNYSVLKYNFSSIDALNRAMNSSDENSLMAGMSGTKSSAENGFTPFEMKKGTLYRNFNKTPLSTENEEDAQNLEMAKSMLGEAKYHFNYTFEGKASKSSSKIITVTPDKKGVSGAISFVELMELQDKMSFTVKVK